MNIIKSPEKHLSFCSELSPSVPLGENISVAVKAAWESIKKPNKWPLVVLKTIVAIPATLILTALTLSLVGLAILLHIAVFPILMSKSGWKNYISSGAKDIKAFVIAVLTCFIGGTQFDPLSLPKGQKADKPPVLLIHGYLHSSAAWHFIRKHLENEGIRTYTVDLGSPCNSISNDLAEKVKKKAEQIAKDCGRNDLIIVGHSMGGLVGAEYTTTMAPEGTVKAVITLGSPLHGTKVATPFPGASANEMRYNSTFVVKLIDKIKRATNTLFFNFGSQVDLVVQPTSSMLLPKSSHIRTHEFSDCGHLSYLYSPTIAKAILQICNSIET